MSLSAWRRRRKAIEKYVNLKDIRELIYSTGLFQERSTGRFYFGDSLRVRVVPINNKGYAAVWEVFRYGYVKTRWHHSDKEKVYKQDWFEVSLEELISEYLDKEDAKKFIFNLDVFLDLE